MGADTWAVIQWIIGTEIALAAVVIAGIAFSHKARNQRFEQLWKRLDDLDGEIEALGKQMQGVALEQARDYVTKPELFRAIDTVKSLIPSVAARSR